jgi:hypothetical protein
MIHMKKRLLPETIAGCCKHCRLRSIHLEIKYSSFYACHTTTACTTTTITSFSLSLANIEVAAKPKDGRNEANLFGNHV